MAITCRGQVTTEEVEEEKSSATKIFSGENFTFLDKLSNSFFLLLWQLFISNWNKSGKTLRTRKKENRCVWWSPCFKMDRVNLHPSLGKRWRRNGKLQRLAWAYYKNDPIRIIIKHCQRHNGPEGWVLLPKVTSLGHITSSYTNLDQTFSESRPSTNFKISTKHQHFDKT